jgi:hypothetical protein
MSTDYVTLALVPGGAWAGLRELCGYDEESVEGTDTVTAIQLLDHLLVDRPGTTIGPGNAAKLTATDRDRLLAAIYARTYGSRIESTIQCLYCNEPFDLDFDLYEILDGLDAAKGTMATEETKDVFTLPDGRQFRLPTGEDEFAVCHLPADKAESELLARCLLKNNLGVESEDIQAAMQEIAPVLDLELNALCPECGRSQHVRFDMQSYLLSALAAERVQLTLEVHRLAMAYGWNLQDILALPRSQRRTYVALVENEIEHSQRWHE